MTSSSLYVGNLPFSTTNDDLIDHLASMGVGGLLTANVAMKGQRSKGWAIVEFESPEFAVSAMGILDGSNIEGRPLLVREDRGERKPAPSAPQQQQQRQPRAPIVHDDTPTNSLYVGNLPWEVTSEDLAAMFAGIEVVTCEVQKRLSGRSKGFGTVQFRSVEDATAAIGMVQGQVVDGRTLSVRYDQEQQPAMPTNQLFVGNLPWSVDDEQLIGMFTGYQVLSGSVKVANGRSRGYGIIEMASLEEAERCLMDKAEGFEYEGRTIFCRFDRHLN